MRIMTLAVGMATGYVLGTRAGREKYNQIVAAARKVSASTGVTGYKSDAASIATPTAAPSIEQPTPAIADEMAPKPRNRRTNASAKPAARSASDQSTADLGVDSSLPMESAEADFVEQNTPVVDNSDESVLAPTPLESDAADVQEQRRSV